MKAYVTFTKKGLSALLAAIVVFLLVCGEVYAVNNAVKNADTNKKRVDYITALGVTLKSDTATKKCITIPQTFSAVYNNYNLLQKKADFNLEGFKGVEVTVYTYLIDSPRDYTGNWACNILVYNGRIIGGDISSFELGGNMLPLVKL